MLNLTPIIEAVNNFSAGFCTVLGDNYNVGNNYTIEDHVKIGDNFTAGNGQGGANVEIFAGAIIGDNVNAGTTDVADGVIIPDHTPEMSCNAPWHAGMAYALGYLKAVLKTLVFNQKY